jgi:hypothetical protein
LASTPSSRPSPKLLEIAANVAAKGMLDDQARSPPESSSRHDREFAARSVPPSFFVEMIPQIGERPDNPVIAPGSIFLSHPNNQSFDFFVDWRSARGSMTS